MDPKKEKEISLGEILGDMPECSDDDYDYWKEMKKQEDVKRYGPWTH